MGTALAYPLADNGHAVRLVGTHLDGEIIHSCLERRYHPKLKRQIPDAVQPYDVDDIAQALDGADLVVSGVSSLGVRWIGQTIGPYLRPGQAILSVTKGLEATEDGDLVILPDVLAGELYDLEQDPREWHSRFDDEKYAIVRRRMCDGLLKHLQRYGSALPPQSARH